MEIYALKTDGLTYYVGTVADEEVEEKLAVLAKKQEHRDTVRFEIREGRLYEGFYYSV
jgi:hypothetical protein